jgi:plasmid stability protein
MPDVLIRDLPKKTLEALKQRAARHGRSLQQELKVTLVRLGEEPDFDYVEHVRMLRERIESYAPQQSDSTLLIREDRGR